MEFKASGRDAVLLEIDGKPARERLTFIRLFEELRGFHQAVSYDAVPRDMISWRAERDGAGFRALIFAPGEAYQLDRSHEIVVLNGATR